MRPLVEAADRGEFERATWLAIAESPDARHAAYCEAADQIMAAREEDPELGLGRISKVVGRSESWVQRLVKGCTRMSLSVAELMELPRDLRSAVAGLWHAEGLA